MTYPCGHYTVDEVPSSPSEVDSSVGQKIDVGKALGTKIQISDLHWHGDYFISSNLKDNVDAELKSPLASDVREEAKQRVS